MFHAGGLRRTSTLPCLGVCFPLMLVILMNVMESETDAYGFYPDACRMAGRQNCCWSGLPSYLYKMRKEQIQKYSKILKMLRRYRREGWELRLEDRYSTPRQIAKARAVCEDACDYMPDFVVDPRTGHKFINHNFVRNECWNKALAANSQVDLWISDITSAVSACFMKKQESLRKNVCCK